MKEPIDLKKIWEWCAGKWRTSFGAVVLAVVAFLVGMAVQEKLIVDVGQKFSDGSSHGLVFVRSGVG